MLKKNLTSLVLSSVLPFLSFQSSKADEIQIIQPRNKTFSVADVFFADSTDQQVLLRPTLQLPFDFAFKNNYFTHPQFGERVQSSEVEVSDRLDLKLFQLTGRYNLSMPVNAISQNTSSDTAAGFGELGLSKNFNISPISSTLSARYLNNSYTRQDYLTMNSNSVLPIPLVKGLSFSFGINHFRALESQYYETTLYSALNLSRSNKGPKFSIVLSETYYPSRESIKALSANVVLPF